MPGRGLERSTETNGETRMVIQWLVKACHTHLSRGAICRRTRAALLILVNHCLYVASQTANNCASAHRSLPPVSSTPTVSYSRIVHTTCRVSSALPNHRRSTLTTASSRAPHDVDVNLLTVASAHVGRVFQPLVLQGCGKEGAWTFPSPRPRSHSWLWVSKSQSLVLRMHRS